MQKINKELKAKKDEYTALSTESIRGIREIKTLGIKNNLRRIKNKFIKRSK